MTNIDRLRRYFTDEEIRIFLRCGITTFSVAPPGSIITDNKEIEESVPNLSWYKSGSR